MQREKTAVVTVGVRAVKQWFDLVWDSARPQDPSSRPVLPSWHTWPNTLDIQPRGLCVS